jgi:hypothetical protein
MEKYARLVQLYQQNQQSRMITQSSVTTQANFFQVSTEARKNKVNEALMFMMHQKIALKK